MNKQSILTTLLLLGCFHLKAQVDQNYVRTHTYLTPRTVLPTESESMNLPNTDVTITTQYFDGLGRLTQSVTKQGSAAEKDVIQHVEYDEFGRQTRTHLPYSGMYLSGGGEANGLYKEGAAGSLVSFCNNIFSNETNPGDYAFSENDIEASPLNRVIATYASGQPWAKSGGDRPVTFAYRVNTVDDHVRQWYIGTDPSSEPISTGEYENTESTNGASLSVVETTDEHGYKTIEFTDKQGRTVLKKVQESDEGTNWMETYYIYDDFGNLRYVLPPKATNLIQANNWMISNTVEQELVFYYVYDARQRMVVKKVPGAEEIYMVYDERDRLVLTQDGNQRTTAYGGSGKDWTFTKYDALNRPVLTGIYEHPIVIDQGVMQSHISDEVNENYDWFETVQISDGVHGYTNKTFPDVTDETKYLSATYYDNYDVVETWGTDYEYSGSNKQTLIKGQVTGTKTKVLDSTNTWLENAIYYDKKYRQVYMASKNYFGAVDQTSNTYDFVGNVIAIESIHKVPGKGDQVVKRWMHYDHAQRLISTEHELNNSGNMVILFSNQYNELGELINKGLHVTEDQNGLALNAVQSIDYQYNVRGWLKSINKGAPHVPSVTTPDVFSMELFYNNSINGL